MRFGFSGPRIGVFRPWVSFDGRRLFARARPAGAPVLGATDSIYVIEGHGMVKIGVSNDPAARRATLQTGTPFPLVLAYSIPMPRAYEIEQEAHQLLAGSRNSGEWFNTSTELALAAVFGAADRLGVKIGADGPSVAEGEPAAKQTALLIALVVALLFIATTIYPARPDDALLQAAPHVHLDDNICGPGLDGPCTDADYATMRANIERVWKEAPMQKRAVCRAETSGERLFLCLVR